MNKEELDTLIEQFPDIARRAVAELYDHILEAAAAAMTEQQEKDKPGTPWLKVGLTLNANANDASDFTVDATVGVKYKAHVSPHDLKKDDTPELEEDMGKSESPRRKAGKNKAAELRILD